MSAAAAATRLGSINSFSQEITHVCVCVCVVTLNKKKLKKCFTHTMTKNFLFKFILYSKLIVFQKRNEFFLEEIRKTWIEITLLKFLFEGLDAKSYFNWRETTIKYFSVSPLDKYSLIA